MPSKQHHAFSLVELSIVLVILGLLVGGVLAGQSLIRASELRAVSTETQKIVTAMHTFRDRYFMMPGDFNRAEDVWGTDPDGCPVHTTRTSKRQTCNGNGSGTLASATGQSEMFRAWQHLANAGLLEGSYTGITGAGGTGHALIGDNVPRSKLNQSGYSFQASGFQGVTSSSSRFASDYGPASMILGKEDGTNALYARAIRGDEAWNIDTKMDDGRPAFGKIMGFTNTRDATCVDSDTAASAMWVLNNSNIGCNLIIKTL